MPTYEYICLACSGNFDIFHKVKEIEADIICPSCGSGRYKKIFSVSNVINKSAFVKSQCPESACGMNAGGCCHGSCDDLV